MLYTADPLLISLTLYYASFTINSRFTDQTLNEMDAKLIGHESTHSAFRKTLLGEDISIGYRDNKG